MHDASSHHPTQRPSFMKDGTIRLHRGENIWDGRLAFGHKLLNEREDIVCFVGNRLGWDGAGKYNGFFKGSFNPNLVLGKTKVMT